MTQAQAYIAGWNACMNGVDGRYCPEGLHQDTGYAWTHGFLNAMESEDGEEPEPACAGYND
jgi:hypothetical protein